MKRSKYIWEIPELKLYPNDWYRKFTIEENAKIQFENATKLRNFINDGDRICKIQNNANCLYKIVKIKKIKQFSLEVIIEKITLREYNLDKILS